MEAVDDVGGHEGKPTQGTQALAAAAGYNPAQDNNAGMTLVKSAERTLRLFEIFSSERRPLTVTEIAAALAIPQPSASMLVKSFLAMGYLEASGEGRRYYPTLRVMLLGVWMNRAHPAVSRLPQLIEEVSSATGESVVLAIKNRIYSQYVLSNVGSSRNPLGVEDGLMYPLACCSTGWCLLSGLPDEEVARIVTRTKIEAPRRYWQSRAHEAKEKVRQFRACGFVVSDGQTEPGQSAIAIALGSQSGVSMMAVAVGGPAERISRKQDAILAQLDHLSNAYRDMSDRLFDPEAA